MLKSCFILALIFLVMLGNLAESKENPVGVMPYKYIEWIDLADRKAPEDISNLIIDHLREPYESALEFSKNAPIYTPSVEYVSTDVNKDGSRTSLVVSTPVLSAHGIQAVLPLC